VELFEEIRREYGFGVGTIAGVAKKLNIHWRMVREPSSPASPTISTPDIPDNPSRGTLRGITVLRYRRAGGNPAATG